MSKIWDWATRDVMLKVLAVFVAASLWLLASNEQNPIVSVEISGVVVDVNGLQAGTAPVEMSPRTVTVIVRGRQNRVARLNRSDILATVDMQGTRQGTSIRVVDAVVPEGLVISEIRPDIITVTVDEMIHRQVPIEIELTGDLRGGYVLGDMIAKPTHVYVQGPKARVSEVDRAIVTVDVTGADSDVIRMLPIQVQTEDGGLVTGLTVVPQTVEVEVVIARVPPSRTVPVLVTIAGDVESGYVVTGVSARPDHITVRGQVENTNSVDTRLVDITGLNEDLVISVPLVLPVGVTSAVSSVEVSVQVEKISQQTLGAIPVRVINLATGLRAVSVPSTVAVVVSGPESLLSELSHGAISVMVDADGLGPGEYELDMDLILPGILTGTCEPAVVQVTVVVDSE